MVLISEFVRAIYAKYDRHPGLKVALLSIFFWLISMFEQRILKLFEVSYFLIMLKDSVGVMT